MTERTKRIGLYIQVDTRNRLNWLKAQLTLERGRVISQDEAINYLLDLVNVPAVAIDPDNGADHESSFVLESMPGA